MLVGKTVLKDCSKHIVMQRATYIFRHQGFVEYLH